MCGIAGIYGDIEKKSIKSMLDIQNYRGPDGSDIWISKKGNYSLGHVRLAIIDVDGGKQPIPNEDNTIFLAVNGEVYNYKKLRHKLEENHEFRTQSDSEVILHLYEEEGINFLKKIKGMFAIAIFDEDKGLVLARDPLGIKPLYYGILGENSLYYSSEIKCLLPYIKNVRELPNGSYLLNGKVIKKFYHIPRPTNYLNHSEKVIKQLDTTLTESIKKRLMSDVPLGVFLSGGLDSSLIAAIMRKHKEGELHSFSIGFQNSQDILNARLASKHIGTIHHEQVITPEDIIEVLPKVIYHLESCDPALIRSSVPTYFVSQLASQYVKVVLSGEGADELFAGYHYLTEEDYDLDNLSNELYQITCSLHNSNLQRVDRMTMAHGLEGRVPFLDVELISLAFKISIDLKVRESAKWVLRKVAEKYLPKKIVWRIKEKFAIGTGIGQFLQNYAEDNIIQAEIEEEFKESGINFVSKEELLYWRYFKNHYNRLDIIESMGRSRSLNPGEIWESAL